MNRINVVLKTEINTLARGFYSMMGYKVEEFYDFSVAKHPTEKMCWEQAKLSYEFWVGRKQAKAQAQRLAKEE